MLISRVVDVDVAPDGRVYVSGSGRLAYSDDEGETWHLANSPGDGHLHISESGRIFMFAGSSDGLLEYIPVLDATIQRSTGTFHYMVSSEHPFSITYLASRPTGSGPGLYYSENQGASWTKAEVITENGSEPEWSRNISSIFRGQSGRWFAGFWGQGNPHAGVVQSDDDGKTWSDTRYPFRKPVQAALNVSGDRLLLATDAAVYHSEDNLESLALSRGLTGFKKLLVDDATGSIYAMWNGTWYRSEDSGSSFEEISFAKFEGLGIQQMVFTRSHRIILRLDEPYVLMISDPLP
jgi:hypothetical protein